MPHATSGGCRIYYELRGDAALPTLVLVRGLTRSSRYWGPLLPELEPHFRLLLVDNRGVGYSDATRPPYTTRMLADDIAVVMDAAGIDRAHVFGMSLGGMIVQQLALAHGDRIDRLVLGCTTPGGRGAHRTPRKAQLAMLRGAFGRPEAMQALLLEDNPDPRIVEEWRRLAKTEPPPLRGVIGQVFAATRHVADVRAIPHRTLVITGDDDIIIPSANSRLLAETIPNATLVMLPGARHDFTTDRPQETATHLRAFLR